MGGGVIDCKPLPYTLESPRDDRGGMQVSYKLGRNNVLCGIGDSSAERDPLASLGICVSYPCSGMANWRQSQAD